MTENSQGQITAAELERLRSKLGTVVQVSERPYLTQATRDSIRRWALATGDRNPLYLDENYAASTVHGSIVAPPCMPYAFSRLSIGYRGGLPGVHSMFGGSHWRWFQHLPVDTSVSSTTTFTDLIELPSRFAGRMFKQLSTTTFVNDTTGETFAEVTGWGMRTERKTAKSKGKYDGTRLKTYQPEEIAEIADRYRSESCRGSEILYWNDVKPGDDVPTIIRGPYTPTSAIAFEQAWGGLFVHAHGSWFSYLDAHPAAGILNAYGIPEPPEAVHWDGPLARSVGVPEAYDYGPERISWLSTLLTNWIGDHGFLQELYTEIRRFNLVGDLSTCRAVVEEVSSESGADTGEVRLSVQIVNQREEVTAKGFAVVRLPRR